jgi:hypothetical protein
MGDGERPRARARALVPRASEYRTVTRYLICNKLHLNGTSFLFLFFFSFFSSFFFCIPMIEIMDGNYFAEISRCFPRCINFFTAGLDS